MDLISRAWLKEAIHNFFNGLTHEVTEEDIQRYIEATPSAFKGMTNGDVLKAIFPDCIDYHGIIEVKTHLDMGKTFRRSWWDSPYKGQDGLI